MLLPPRVFLDIHLLSSTMNPVNLIFLTLVSLLIGTAPFVRAEIAPLEQRVVEHNCPNGIKLLILERHFSPTVAIRMMFRTGSVDETDGKTGLAHMFEHMMFKGTKTLGTKNYRLEAPLLKSIDQLHQDLDTEKAKNQNADQAKIAKLLDQLRDLEAKEASLVSENELWNLYEREGGSGINAATSHDFTEYVVDLPSNKLKLWALLDSDRIRNPVFRQFYPEREVVKEERRMRVDTNPEGKLFEEFLATSYLQHPYHHPTLGWDSDLDHLTVKDLEDFYHHFYTPNQLTIAVVGDVKAQEAISLVDQYFGSWNVAGSTRPLIAPEPAQASARKTTVKFDAQPHLIVGYHLASYPDPEHDVAFALSELLGSGTTSRLYKTIVQKKRLATSIETGQDYPGERYAPLLLISAAPRFPHTVDEVIQAVHTELDRVKKEPIAEWEMEKMRAAVNVGLLSQLQTNAGMASTLVYDQCIFGDWRYLLRFQKRINEMTSAEVQALARKLFKSENETVAVIVSTKTP